MKNLLKLQALVVIMITALFASCSSDENLEMLENDAASAVKEYVYNMQFDAPAPAFDGLSSRATSWANGSVVYLKFKNGSSYVYGKATYSTSTSSWTIVSNSSIPATSTETQVSAYYIDNAQSTSSSEVRLSPTSVSYSGSGTYTSSSSTIYVKVTMTPETGRLRFKGTSGTSITVKPSDGHLCTYASFGISDCSFRYEKNDISLSVKSTGYTDYVYGYFEYVSGSTYRTLTVTTDATYQRKDISSSAMADGQSACLTVPTKSNYQSLGWTLVGGNTGTIDKNAYVSVNFFVPFTDGYCTDWTVGSTAKTFYFTVYKNLSSTMSDEDLIADVKEDNSARDAQSYTNTISRHNSTFFSSTSDTYTLVTIAYNSNGERGPINKYNFKINSTSLPVATLSNLKLTSDSEGNCWTFDVSLKNGATKYYIWNSYDEDLIARDEHFNAWNFYYNIKNGINTSTYTWESVRMGRNTSKVVIMTYAANSSNTIGNYNTIKYPASSSAKATKPSTDYSSRTKFNDEMVSIPKVTPFRLNEYDIHQFKIK